jgi:hypothetical protein
MARRYAGMITVMAVAGSLLLMALFVMSQQGF